MEVIWTTGGSWETTGLYCRPLREVISSSALSISPFSMINYLIDSLATPVAHQQNQEQKPTHTYETDRQRERMVARVGKENKACPVESSIEVQAGAWLPMPQLRHSPRGCHVSPRASRCTLVSPNLVSSLQQMPKCLYYPFFLVSSYYSLFFIFLFLSFPFLLLLSLNVVTCHTFFFISRKPPFTNSHSKEFYYLFSRSDVKGLWVCLMKLNYYFSYIQYFIKLDSDILIRCT